MLKISLGIFMLRIVIEVWQQRVIQIMIIASTITCAANLLEAIFQCGVTKSTADWIIKQFADECLPNPAGLILPYIHGAVTTITDFTFVVLPIFVLSKLNMARKAKLTILGLLVLGGM